MLDKVADACKYLLDNFPGANDVKSYLDARLNQNSQDLFQFGYFPEINNLQLLIDIVGEDLLKKEKLIYSKNIEDSLCARTLNMSFFKDQQLIMPFKDMYGDVVALVARSLLSDEDRKKDGISKYKNTEFIKGNFLFGMYENKKSILEENAVYVVEGQFDVIKASERGFKNVVALGSAAMTAYQLSIITRYTDNIFLLLDNDEAGRKGRARIIDKYGKFANIQNVLLPEQYKDIDEYLTMSGDSYMEICFR